MVHRHHCIHLHMNPSSALSPSKSLINSLYPTPHLDPHVSPIYPLTLCFHLLSSLNCLCIYLPWYHILPSLPSPFPSLPLPASPLLSYLHSSLFVNIHGI